MIHAEDFWKLEKDATLLSLNEGFLQSEDGIKAIKEASRQWTQLLQCNGNYKSKEAPPRILYADAGLGYVGSFLRLLFDEETATEMILKLATDAKYIPGYWIRQDEYATDVYVFGHLLQQHFPEIYEHLSKHLVPPETYIQKWFVGLCVHVLPFETLFVFLEEFFRGGFKVLFQFGLSLVHHLKDELLKSTETSTLLGLLRLDPKYITSDRLVLSRKILNSLSSFDMDACDFTELRKLYEDRVKQRLSTVKYRNRKDEEQDEDDASEDEEEGDECSMCNNMMPEVFCEECKLPMCDMCHEDFKEPHKKDHRVVPLADANIETELLTSMKKLNVTDN